MKPLSRYMAFDNRTKKLIAKGDDKEEVLNKAKEWSLKHRGCYITLSVPDLVFDKFTAGGR